MKHRLIRFGYLFYKPFRRLYFHIVQPFTSGVRALVLNDQGQILLVKHSYDRGWFLPGGGVEKGENFSNALKRELREELSLEDYKIEKLLGVYTNLYEGKTDHIAVFVISNFSPIQTDALEVAEYGFFDPKALPDGISPGSRKRILEYIGQKEIDYWW